MFYWRLPVSLHGHTWAAAPNKPALVFLHPLQPCAQTHWRDTLFSKVYSVFYKGSSEDQVIPPSNIYVEDWQVVLADKQIKFFIWRLWLLDQGTECNKGVEQNTDMNGVYRLAELRKLSWALLLEAEGSEES